MKPTVCLIPPPQLPIPAVQGGAVEGLITHLIEENEQQQKMELVVFTIPDAKAQALAKQYRHTRFHFIKHKKKRGVWALMCGALRRMGYPAPLDFWFEKVRHILRKENPAYVVAEGGNFREFGAIARQTGRSRMVAHLHSSLHYHPCLSPLYSKVLGISQFVADCWQDDTAHKAMVPNCVDQNLFHPASDPASRQMFRQQLGLSRDDIAVLFCGRIHPAKGIHRLVEAMAQLDDPRYKLIVVGSPFFAAQSDNDFFRQLRQQADALGDRIIFTGFVKNQELPRYYQAADLACLPSLCLEGAGITGIEAMACGCPVIGVDTGGMPEYLQGGGALLLPRQEGENGEILLPQLPSMATLIAQAIRQLGENPALRQQMAEKGIAQAQSFSRQQFYQAFYKAVCEL